MSGAILTQLEEAIDAHSAVQKDADLKKFIDWDEAIEQVEMMRTVGTKLDKAIGKAVEAAIAIAQEKVKRNVSAPTTPTAPTPSTPAAPTSSTPAAPTPSWPPPASPPEVVIGRPVAPPVAQADVMESLKLFNQAVASDHMPFFASADLVNTIKLAPGAASPTAFTACIVYALYLGLVEAVLSALTSQSFLGTLVFKGLGAYVLSVGMYHAVVRSTDRTSAAVATMTMVALLFVALANVQSLNHDLGLIIGALPIAFYVAKAGLLALMLVSAVSLANAQAVAVDGGRDHHMV